MRRAARLGPGLDSRPIGRPLPLRTSWLRSLTALFCYVVHSVFGKIGTLVVHMSLHLGQALDAGAAE